jgi:hypothetical protein
LSKLKSFASLNAEAGQTYYYRALITYAGDVSFGQRMNLGLGVLDPEEARYLISSAKISQATTQVAPDRKEGTVRQYINSNRFRRAGQCFLSK